jgi:hypothetical protein
METGQSQVKLQVDLVSDETLFHRPVLLTVLTRGGKDTQAASWIFYEY